MGNVHVGNPRTFLVRRKLRRLFKKMTILLIEIDDADVLNPQRIAQLRNGLVGSLGLVRLELIMPGSTRRQLQTAYNKAITIYNVTKELFYRFNVEVFNERHERIDIL